MTNERRISVDIHVETMNEFREFSIHSTISNSEHINFNKLVDAISDYEELVEAVSNSKELVDEIRYSEQSFDSVSDPKSYPKSDQIVATHNSYGRKRKSLIVALPKEIFHTNH